MFNQLKPSLECSRIDLQLTIPLPCPINESYTNFQELTDECADGIKRGDVQGQRCKVNSILSHDGFCTLYVGDRSSQRFYRIYVKENSEKHYIRFEVEYKKKSGLAGRIYREINKEPEKISNLIAAEIESLPPHLLTNPIKTAVSATIGDFMKNGRIEKDPNKTLRWMRHQVKPAFKRLIGNHDTRDAAIMLLDDLIRFAKEVEGIGN
jgi:hypothetical protein